MKKKSGHYTVEANNLIYHPEGKGASVKIKGQWALDKKHNLVFLVNRTQNDTFGESISFQGKIEEAKYNRIGFKVLERHTPSHRHIKRIYLNGTWGADKYNRLTFRLQKDRKNQALVFKNQWRISGDNRLMYAWRADNRCRVSTFTLNGRWAFAGNSLGYKIERSGRSFLKITLDRKKIVCDPKKNRIDFISRFGYETKRGVRIKRKRFSLSGTWKIYSKTKIGFTLRYDRGAPVTWIFPVKVTFAKNRIEMTVTSRRGRKLAPKVSFSREMAKNKEFFLDLTRRSAQFDVQAGLRIIF